MSSPTANKHGGRKPLNLANHVRRRSSASYTPGQFPPPPQQQSSADSSPPLNAYSSASTSAPSNSWSSPPPPYNGNTSSSHEVHTPRHHTSLPPLSRVYSSSQQTSSKIRIGSPMSATGPASASFPFQHHQHHSRSLPQKIAAHLPPPVRIALIFVGMLGFAIYVLTPAPASSHLAIMSHPPGSGSSRQQQGQYTWSDAADGEEEEEEDRLGDFHALTSSSRGGASAVVGYEDEDEDAEDDTPVTGAESDLGWWLRPFKSLKKVPWTSSKEDTTIEEVQNDDDKVPSPSELRPDVLEDEFVTDDNLSSPPFRRPAVGGTSPSAAAAGQQVPPSYLQYRLPPPFLPMSCAPRPCSPLWSPYSSQGKVEPTCARYLNATGGAQQIVKYPGMLKRSVLYPSTGDDIRRVLMRAARRSLAWQAKQREEAKRRLAKRQEDGDGESAQEEAEEQDEGEVEGGDSEGGEASSELTEEAVPDSDEETTTAEEPVIPPTAGDKSTSDFGIADGGFRVLVLGGSVSNCRGVDINKECWHSHVGRLLQKLMPLEAVGAIFQTEDSAAAASNPNSNEAPKQQQKRNIDVEVVDASEVNRLIRRAAVSAERATAPDNGTVARRQESGTSWIDALPRARHSIINLSKSATSSSAFSYCLHADLTSRARHREAFWGLRGPDLVILEFGVNDVIPEPVPGVSPSRTASGVHRTNIIRDFERLVDALKALPSKPAVIALEAASRLLQELRSGVEINPQLGLSGFAPDSGWESNPPYKHLPAAIARDVPVISVNEGFFNGPVAAQEAWIEQDLWLPDGHHPNKAGHQVMGDVLNAWLEEKACEMQELVRVRAAARGADEVDWERDFVEEGEEEDAKRKLTGIHEVDSGVESLRGLGKCAMLGMKGPQSVWRKNRGWHREATARDKQYLVATKPGATVSFPVKILRGNKGEIRFDWLRSRFYNLGDVLVYLDGKRSKGVKCAGWWPLRWSVGMPTLMFENVPIGKHYVTVELLPSSQSSHPEKATEFRIIGLIAS